LYATATDIGQNDVNAVFVDNTHRFGRYSQANPAVFAFDPETVVLQIWRKSSFGSIVCV
jgi:hypothetical protein